MMLADEDVYATYGSTTMQITPDSCEMLRPGAGGL
jgi:hypothetical protein